MNSRKTLYGFLAFAPFIFILLGCIPIVISLIEDSRAKTPPPLAIVGILLLLLGGLMSLVGMVLFLIHASRNKTLDEGERIGWIVGMVMSFVICTGFVTTILTIIYYFMHIARDKPLPPSQPQADAWTSKTNY